MKRFALVLRFISFAAVTACSRLFSDATPPTLDTVNAVRSVEPNSYRSLHSFAMWLGGYAPQAGLTLVDGVLYGTTCLYGQIDSGSVFRMDLSGHVTDIHDFNGPGDGGCSVADLLKVGDKLYGTTQYGGGCYERCGVVFVISRSGSGYSERVLYSFKGGKDGASPRAGLTYGNGIFYGTTSKGGAGGSCRPSLGCGTVFSLTPSGQERVIHSFNGPLDGTVPLSRLKLLDGVLYGTASQGGKYGQGTVFEMSKAGKERILWNLGGGAGAYPAAGLIYYKGYLYGTTAGGGSGASGGGVVFKIDPTGKNRIVLCRFGASASGSNPYAELVAMNNTLYGTTTYGGRAGVGTVFSISPSGRVRTLYSFMNNANDGFRPVARLTPVNGALYGTTQNGGNACNFPGCGTVFKVTPP